MSADAPAVMFAKSVTVRRMAEKAAEIMHHSSVLNDKRLNVSVRLAERLPPKICERRRMKKLLKEQQKRLTRRMVHKDACFWIT